MSKYIVSAFALVCLAAPLFATEPPAAPKTDTNATEMKDGKKDEKMAECPKCHKPMAECKCHKKKGGTKS